MSVSNMIQQLSVGMFIVSASVDYSLNVIQSHAISYDVISCHVVLWRSISNDA